jgi:hypothetical protein
MTRVITDLRVEPIGVRAPFDTNLAFSGLGNGTYSGVLLLLFVP